MKIHTSYFGRVKKLPPDIVPVSICGKPPFPWAGLKYPKLAPKKGFWVKWHDEHLGEDFYREHYKAEVLDLLTPDDVRKELAELTGGKDCALLCLETPERFCHRHLAAEWLGPDVKEWDPEKDHA